MNYFDVIEARERVVTGNKQPLKVTRKRDAMCVTEAIGESEGVSMLHS